MRARRVGSAALFFAAFLVAPRLGAQANSTATGPNAAVSSTSSQPPSNPPNGAQATPVNPFLNHYLWSEEFSGSTDSEGQFYMLDSTLGYVFSPHFGVDAGIPIYFVRGSSTTATGGTTSISHNGFGDVYLQFRLAFANPVVNYKSVLTGTAPTGSTTDGFSTGHATYDWTNRFDRRFGKWTPFAELGIGNSIPETFIFNRPYKSYGHDAHFQVGAGYQIAGWLGVSASAYDIAPWGNQTIFSRVAGGPPSGVGNGHGRVFNLANQTTGSASLAADNGFSAGADFSPSSLLDFNAGYSHSVHFDLNTFTFGVGVNMSEFLRRTHAGF